MMSLFPLFFILILQLSPVYSDCPLIELCDCDTKPNAVICNGNYGNQSDNTYFPPLSLLPSVQEYTFLNFKQIQANAFENLTFPTNHAIIIRLINISVIHPDAFSTSMIIPTNSTISIDIEQSIIPSSITLKSNAFNHIKIHRLRFSNINNFNGRQIFDTTCFGEHVHIKELIFQQSSLTGFSNSIRKHADVKQLSIRECPSFTQLTDKSLPTFLATTELLEISMTGLQLINSHTFQAWSLVLKELIIRNNMNFKMLSSDMTDGTLMLLDKLDLSNNSIQSIEKNYDWFPYSSTKHLVLKQQQQLDLFLKTKILKTLESLRTIDLSESFISGDNNEDLIRNYVPNMRNVVAVNISYTNLTEHMVIDLLTRLSNSANQTIKISLLGHTLNDSQFCSYFTIFDRSPNLLHLELDDTHECNCVVDLFYQDEHIQIAMNDSLKKPACLLDTERIRCNTQSQLAMSKCSVSKPNPDGSGTNGNIGSYAFIGIMVGLSVVLLMLLAVGSGIAYRARQSRRMTILDMEEPIENPLAAIIEERLQKTH